MPDLMQDVAVSLLRQIARQKLMGTVLLVTHGDVGSILTSAAAGRDLREHRRYAMQTAELRSLTEPA